MNDYALLAVCQIGGFIVASWLKIRCCVIIAKAKCICRHGKMRAVGANYSRMSKFRWKSHTVSSTLKQRCLDRDNEPFLTAKTASFMIHSGQRTNHLLPLQAIDYIRTPFFPFLMQGCFSDCSNLLAKMYRVFPKHHMLQNVISWTPCVCF